MSVAATKTTSNYDKIFNDIKDAQIEILNMSRMFLKLLVGKELADDIQKMFDDGICQTMTVEAREDSYCIGFGGPIKHFSFVLSEPKQQLFAVERPDEDLHLRDLLNKVNITIMEYELTPASASLDIATRLRPESFISISLLDIANILAGRGQLYSIKELALAARSLIRATVMYHQLKRSMTRFELSQFVARSMIKDFDVLKEHMDSNGAANSLDPAADKDRYKAMVDTTFTADERNYQWEMVNKILQAS